MAKQFDSTHFAFLMAVFVCHTKRKYGAVAKCAIFHVFNSYDLQYRGWSTQNDTLETCSYMFIT